MRQHSAHGLHGLEGRFLINIDHHNSAREFANVNWIDSSACAVAEMVFRLARGTGARVTPQMATYLYTAVLTETGSFCFAGTKRTHFRACGGIGTMRSESGRHRTPRILLQSHFEDAAFGRGAFQSSSGRHAGLYASLSDEMELSGGLKMRGHCELCAGHSGRECALIFRELADGRYRVSLRSKGQVNVASVAEQFGGGGHTCASGCAVSGPLPVSLELILSRLRNGCVLAGARSGGYRLER